MFSKLKDRLLGYPFQCEENFPFQINANNTFSLFFWWWKSKKMESNNTFSNRQIYFHCS
ncbi:hypothetical protein MtrunA17_Chr5g0438981 [Medicago truncatula]|uniref:Uncharacterized protein n=1 Tax=Medicago truncatula TaxID=3880 RepID=A0A396HVD6_MEDTR|nr:hypothetical protein MtrunA17_Chr5g0438981 [Medicago truncatula]